MKISKPIVTIIALIIGSQAFCSSMSELRTDAMPRSNHIPQAQKDNSIQKQYIDELIRNREPVNITLVSVPMNTSGIIQAQDDTVIILWIKGRLGSQDRTKIIFKKNIVFID